MLARPLFLVSKILFKNLFKFNSDRKLQESVAAICRFTLFDFLSSLSLFTSRRNVSDKSVQVYFLSVSFFLFYFASFSFLFHLICVRVLYLFCFEYKAQKERIFNVPLLCVIRSCAFL